MTTLEDLYNHSTKLSNAKDKIAEHQSDFEAVLGGFGGSSSEKRLACQISATHLHHFPSLADKVLDCIFDLCEDAHDLMVRKQAIKDLGLICKRDVGHVVKVADILVQLLQTSDNLEQTLVCISLTSLLRLDTSATITALFNRMITEGDLLRERALSFVQSRMKIMLNEDLLAKEAVEEAIVANCKKVLEDVTGTEFKSIMRILTCLPSLASLQGRQQLISIVAQQANLAPDADVNDTDNMNCLMECLEQATQLFSKNVKSDKFVEHLCLRVLPNLSTPEATTTDTEATITTTDATTTTTTDATTTDTTEATTDTQLSIFKILAEICAYAGNMKNAEECVSSIYDKLITYMPEAPLDISTTDTFSPLQFSHVECLMTALHYLGKQCEDFLKEAERLKEFRGRLQYFARGVQAYNKSLRSMQDKTPEKRKVKELALKVTSNISILIRDLFHNPPHYTSSINLSFKKPVVATSPGTKRPAAIVHKVATIDVVKKARSDQARYVPPSGKFSSTLSTNTTAGAKKV